MMRLVPLVFLIMAAPVAVIRGEIFESRPGPWGQLEFYETILEPPTHLLWPSLFEEEIVWQFTEKSQEEVQQLLIGFEIDDEWIKALETRAQWRKTETGITVVPPHDLVVELEKAPREKLYRHIWNNGFRDRCFPIEVGEFRSLDRRPIPEDFIRFIEARSLDVDGKQHSCEIPILTRRLATQAQKTEFIRALARTRGLMVRLKIDDKTNLDEVANYWSLDGHRSDVLSILKGVRRAPGVESIDIVQLLPPTPRKYLNTYPQTEEMIRQDLPDCYWASFNFFNHYPRPRLLDTMFLPYHLDHGYELTQDTPRFGDVLLWFENGTGEFIHSCVYIADDIVFTKNGISQINPWILMREADMLSRYPVKRLHRKMYRPHFDSTDS
ncbi:MAG: hypothetical protein ACI8UO_006242 [Verrucomicrobiales bacterium]|jgi:hypothetical protein